MRYRVTFIIILFLPFISKYYLAKGTHAYLILILGNNKIYTPFGK